MCTLAKSACEGRSPTALRVKGSDELQNFGAARADPLPRIFVNVAGTEVKVEWNQHLWKC
jgi:hypothetical protein